MNKFEYLLIFVGKNGFGRTTITLDKPITDVDTITQIDEALRTQSEQDGERDETIFVINYKLLKSYTI
jgi:hypothetical protein